MRICDIDFSGQRFGRLIARNREDKITKRGESVCAWRFVCDCGNERHLAIYGVLKGNTKSCGCFRSDELKANIKHGCSRKRKQDKVYMIYIQMKARCNNPKCKDYYRYGGRGISVCERWLNSFENFLADMGRPGHKESLDRIDLDGNYEPGNCKWATDREQARNRSNNVWVFHDGVKYCMTDYARLFNKNLSSIYGRMKRYGETPEVATQNSKGPFKERVKKRKPKPK